MKFKRIEALHRLEWRVAEKPERTGPHAHECQPVRVSSYSLPLLSVSIITAVILVNNQSKFKSKSIPKVTIALQN